MRPFDIELANHHRDLELNEVDHVRAAAPLPTSVANRYAGLNQVAPAENRDYKTCCAYLGGGLLALGAGMFLITSFTSCSSALIYNNTHQFLTITMYGPNFGGYVTHVSPSFVRPYGTLNMTLNGYNTYADAYTARHGQIHISDWARKAVLKDGPDNLEIVRQSLFNYFYVCHYTLQKKSGSSSQNNTTSAALAADDVTSEMKHARFIEEEVGADSSQLCRLEEDVKAGSWMGFSYKENNQGFFSNATYTKLNRIPELVDGTQEQSRAALG